MIKFIVFIFIALFYSLMAKFSSYDVAILVAVTTLILFEIDRMADE